MEGNFPTYELQKLSIRLTAAAPVDGLVTLAGAAPAAGSAVVAGPVMMAGAVGDVVSVAISGLVQIRLVAGITNAATGAAVAAAANNRIKLAATGEFILGRLMDAIGATASTDDQRARILITREGLQA